MNETLEDAATLARLRAQEPLPGLVAVWSGDHPVCVPFALESGAIELGRDELAHAGCADARVSRVHLRVERGEDRRWRCADRASRNGSWVDGVRLDPSSEHERPPKVIRVGHTLLVPREDLRPFIDGGVRDSHGVVAGPLTLAAFARIEALARAGANVLLQGPSGAGKEVAAAVFHRASPGAKGPLVSVNCATIPRELAERILFGARKGAFTGASDSAGLVQQADGGTLFLDELAELAPPVQAKLLRAIETGTVLPLGATQAVTARFRLCAATLVDLREAVTDGRFREDLYYRVGRPAVALPPLAQRTEEIGFHLDQAARAVHAKLQCTAAFVEACLLRPWPGNVRELRTEARSAAIEALSCSAPAVDVAHLPESAGRPLGEASPTLARAADEPVAASTQPATALSKASVLEALAKEQGNVLRAAERLGVSRAKLRRAIERWAIDPRASQSDD